MNEERGWGRTGEGEEREQEEKKHPDQIPTRTWNSASVGREDPSKVIRFFAYAQNSRESVVAREWQKEQKQRWKWSDHAGEQTCGVSDKQLPLTLYLQEDQKSVEFPKAWVAQEKNTLSAWMSLGCLQSN